MLTAASVCPHPPLLIPEVASGAAGELDHVRAACEASVHHLLAGSPDLLVVVGGDEKSGIHERDAAGSLASYGVDLTVGEGPVTLPLSLTIGRWLLERVLGEATGGPPVRYQSVAMEATAAECRELGKGIASAAEHVAMLCMGDGTVYPTEREPARLSDADTGVARALMAGDARALASIGRTERPVPADPAGLASWRVLAAAAGGGRPRARLLFAGAPYGVGYFVATWHR